MSRENVGAEQQAFNEARASLNRADVNGFIDYVAPHPDWKAVEELHPFGDREAVRRYTAQWLDHWSDFSLDAEDFRRLAEDWLITVRARGRSRDGVDIDDRFYLHVAIREGRILRWHEYSERSEALEAVGLRE
jgi:ketosteroid isomerase-like protein